MARAMAREARRHCVERGLDDRGILWSLGSQELVDLDSAADFFETNALLAYNEAAVHQRMVLQGTWAATGVVAARALASFSDGVRSSSPMKCTLFGLAVHDSSRQQGIGTLLFRRMHAALHSACSRRAMELGKGHPHKLRATLELAPGGCRRQPIALLFYAKQGAAVHACGGEKPLSVEQLVKLVNSGADADQVSADVTFPDLELDRPYLAPLAPRAATPEDVELLFDPPSRGSFPSPHWSAMIPIQGARRRYIHAYMVCDGLTMGTVRIHGQQPSRATGCVEFLVWPWACALLEAYLQDPENHEEQALQARSSNHYLLIRHPVHGGVVARLPGYQLGVTGRASSSQRLRIRVWQHGADIKQALLHGLHPWPVRKLQTL